MFGFPLSCIVTKGFLFTVVKFIICMKYFFIVFMGLLATSFVVANKSKTEVKKTLLNLYSSELDEIIVTSKKVNKNPQHVQDYIATYANLAVSEQTEKGIPASLKIAQGMLESDFGRSKAAINTNAHFCIKGKNSLSIKVYDKVEKSTASYRGYKSVWWSYRDHSNLLLNDNYGWVFEDLTYSNYNSKLDETNKWRERNGFKPISKIWKWRWSKLEDYEKISYGIHVSGYATDSKYSSKISQIIKKYKLYELDKLT